MPASVNKDVVSSYASGLVDFARQYPLGGDVVYKHLNHVTMSDAFHPGMEGNNSIDADYANELKSRLADALYQSAGGDEHIPPEEFESEKYDVPLNVEGLAYLSSVSKIHKDAMPEASFVMYAAGQAMGEMAISEKLKDKPMMSQSEVLDTVMEVGYKGEDLILPHNYKRGLEGLTGGMKVSQIMMPDSEQNMSGVDSLASTMYSFKEEGRTSLAYGSERVIDKSLKDPMEKMSYDVRSEYQIREPKEDDVAMLSREVSSLYNKVDAAVKANDSSDFEDFNKQGYRDNRDLFDVRAGLTDVNRGLVASAVSNINTLNVNLSYNQALEQRNEFTREDKPLYVVSTGEKFDAWPQGDDKVGNIQKGTRPNDVYTTDSFDVAARIAQMRPDFEVNEIKVSSQQMGDLYRDLTKDRDLSRVELEVPIVQAIDKYGDQGRTPQAMSGLIMKGLSAAGHDLDPSSAVEIERGMYLPNMNVSDMANTIQSNEQDVELRQQREEEQRLRAEQNVNNPPTQEIDKPNFFQGIMNKFR